MGAPVNLAGTLLAAAERLMPSDRRDWARAMAAEQAAVGQPGEAVAFAAGCLRAAGRERLRSMAPDGKWAGPGLTFGMLAAATALIPGSGSLALLWAPVAGLLTIAMPASSGSRPTFSGAVILALKAGLVSGAVLLTFTLLPGIGSPTPGDRLSALLVAAACAALLTTIGGIAAAPLVSKPPGPHAPPAQET